MDLTLNHFGPAAMAGLAAPSRTLLLVIDIQRDFAAPDGAMGQIGLDLAAAEAAIDRIELLIAAARRAGVTVGFARVLSSEETESVALREHTIRRGHDPSSTAICREGTKGAEFYRVRPEPGDIEIGKQLYSCFSGTDLEADLRQRGFDTLVITGISTNCCVDSTTRDAFHRNFHLFVVEDACADYSPEAHQAALAALGMHCAVLVDSATILLGWHEVERAEASL